MEETTGHGACSAASGWEQQWRGSYLKAGDACEGCMEQDVPCIPVHESCGVVGVGQGVEGQACERHL